MLILVDNTEKAILNSELSSAYVQSKHKLKELINPEYLYKEEKLKVFKEMKEDLKENKIPDKFKVFVENYFHKSFFEWFVYGNISEDKSIELTKIVQNSLQKETLNEEKHIVRRTIKINNIHSYYEFNSKDNENENSCLLSYYQFGYLTEIEKCISTVIEEVYKEKFFDELRTKQQLGYHVHLYKNSNYKVDGLILTVQSSILNPNAICKRFNEFFESNNIETILNEEDIQEYIESVITNLKQKDLNMAEEFERLFNEICARSYFFNRHEKRIEILKDLSEDEIIEFFNEKILNNKNKLDIQIVSKLHEDDNSKESTNRNKIISIEAFKKSNELYPDFYYC